MGKISWEQYRHAFDHPDEPGSTEVIAKFNAEIRESRARDREWRVSYSLRYKSIPLDERWPFAFRIFCPYCGHWYFDYSRTSFDDETRGGPVKGLVHQHNLVSPTCWEADQAYLQQLRRSTDKYVRLEVRLRPIRKWKCPDCDRIIFGFRRGSRCVHCARDRKLELQDDRRLTTDTTKVCPVCAKRFIAKRADAKTCSPKCRQSLYRSGQGLKKR